MKDNKKTIPVQDLTFTFAEINALRSALAVGTVLAETAKKNAELGPCVELYGGWQDELDTAIALVSREADRIGNIRFAAKEGGGI